MIFHYLQGKLLGQGLEDQLPTIALIAHYDSSGMIPVSFFISISYTYVFVNAFVHFSIHIFNYYIYIYIFIYLYLYPYLY